MRSDGVVFSAVEVFVQRSEQNVRVDLRYSAVVVVSEEWETTKSYQDRDQS